MTNLQNNQQETPLLVKRGKGRPKGSKNKPKITPSTECTSSDVLGVSSFALEQAPVKRRGRPKGAKNKPKQVVQDTATPAVSPVTLDSTVISLAVNTPQVNEPLKIPEVVHVTLPSSEPKAEANPIMEAAKWLEKKMPIIEVQYYRQRASKQGTTIATSIALAILSLFNVQDQEIRKQVKI